MLWVVENVRSPFTSLAKWSLLGIIAKTGHSWGQRGERKIKITF